MPKLLPKLGSFQAGEELSPRRFFRLNFRNKFSINEIAKLLNNIS